jgi:ABC-type sugar transport system ATPase subunit
MRRWSASVQKATILRMLAGHERASEGDIILDRLNDTDLPPVCRGTAMMFQSYALFPELCGNLGDGLIRRRSALACR